MGKIMVSLLLLTFPVFKIDALEHRIKLMFFTKGTIATNTYSYI